MKRYDCHCHIFNIVDVGLKAILEQLIDAKTFISDADGKIMKTDAVDEKNKLDFGDRIKKIAELIKIFTKSSKGIFEMLDDHYHQQYVLFPLMFDGDFLLDSADINEKANFFAMKDEDQNSFFNHLRNLDNKDGKSVLDFIGNIFTSDKGPESDKSILKSGFEKQYEAIKEISNNPALKDRIRPFLGVDPRRSDIKNYLSQIGKNKLFAGVKVYPPNGFSPTDPVLYDVDGIFEYCCNHKIPVVSHSSFGGFATPVKSLNVNGYIIQNDQDEPTEYDGIYNFKYGLDDSFSVLVRERAGVLNHPKIWEKVLEKYPDMILVLAHFGSGSDEWRNYILNLMKKYKNLYTDVSCMSEDETLKWVKTVYDTTPEIRSKIFYGSDYFLDMFFNDSFDAYLSRMQNIFGSAMFDQLSISNPVNYMNSWYKTV